MSKGRSIRSFEYVNHPYEQVRDALADAALDVFRSATSAATTRAESVASELKVSLGAIEVGAEIDIKVKEIEDRPADSPIGPQTRLQLEWAAKKSPRLFPFMQAELAIYRLTATETQLDFSGSYDPPLGLLGGAVDALVGHRIAEASVHRFVADVADYLKRTLT
jgi:hypothetical protein